MEQVPELTGNSWAEPSGGPSPSGFFDFAWSSMSFSSLWKQKFSFVLAKLQAQAIEIAASGVRRGLVDVASV